MAARRTTKTAPATTDNGVDLSNDPFVKFLLGIKNVVDAALVERVGGDADAIPTDPPFTPDPPKGKRATRTPEPEPEEDEEGDDDPQAARRAELATKTVAALQKILVKAGFDPDEVKAEKDKETLIDSIVEDEASTGDDDDADDVDADDDAADDAADDDTDDDESEDDEDGEEEDEYPSYTRDELMALSLTALKRVAKDEYSMDAASLKGLDKDALVDILLNDEENDEEEGDDEEGYTEEELNDLSLAELKDIAKEWEIKVRPGTKQAGYVAAILKAQEDYAADEED